MAIGEHIPCACALCRPWPAPAHFVKPCGHAPELLCGCGLRTETTFRIAPGDMSDWDYVGRHRPEERR
jgi:hypothetical protein